jgi:hypothetical protein
MFSRNRTSKPEPTPEELREKALDRLHTTAVSGRVDLLGPVVSQRPSTYQARLRALVAYGAASAEIAGQGGRRASVGKAAAGEVIAGPAGAVVPGARGKKRKTTVAIRDGQGRLKLTEVKGAERAHRFAELFNHLAAQARQTAS